MRHNMFYTIHRQNIPKNGYQNHPSHKFSLETFFNPAGGNSEEGNVHQCPSLLSEHLKKWEK